jgi:multicomponent Na+:H+ antiporter subunit G
MMDSVMYILAGLCFAVGSIAILIGSIGLVRMPDVFSRIHAAGMVDTAGVAFMILGMVLLSPSWLVTVKLILIGVFLFFTSPVSGHAIALVAKECGVKPLGRDLASSSDKEKTSANKEKSS